MDENLTRVKVLARLPASLPLGEVDKASRAKAFVLPAQDLTVQLA